LAVQILKKEQFTQWKEKFYGRKEEPESFIL